MADDDILTGARVGGTVATVISGTIAGVWYIINKMRRGKQQDERTAIGYYRGIIDKLNLRDELREKQITDAQAGIDILQKRCNARDVDNESLWGVAKLQYEQAKSLYDFACSLRDLLNQMGHPIPIQPREPIPLPERKNSSEQIKSTDFANRTQEQRNVTISDLNSRIKILSDTTKSIPTNNNKQP